MNCPSLGHLVTLALLSSTFAGGCEGDTLWPEPEAEPDAAREGEPPAAPDAAAPDAARDFRKEAASFVVEPAACSDDSECCVVLDSCRSNALVVGARDFASVRALIDMAPADRCHACIPADVEVGCVQGRCVGAPISKGEAGVPAGLRQHHCGNLGVIDLQTSDGGAATVLRCGG
jgi:hypothetical protein